MLRSIVEHAGGNGKGEITEQATWESEQVRSTAIRKAVLEHMDSLFAFLERPGDTRRFDEVERGLIPMIFALGRLLLAYFLAVREEQIGGSREEVHGDHRIAEPKRRILGTFFGRVIFWRTHLRPRTGRGHFPLDLALGLTTDGFTFLVMSLCARLATVVTYDQVTALCLRFLCWSPSKTTVEKAVLGFGAHTEAWFHEAPAPQGDGEVLVIQIDSKATPTATESELQKRRGKRAAESRAPSPRHRGRRNRQRRGPKIRRKKGDKAKNGKIATVVVMYTLKRSIGPTGERLLLGPINRKLYASYGPKRHAVEVARREADKRGFTKRSRKTIQIVTDGDPDLQIYCKDDFPGAKHTLDIIHAIEYLWTAGGCLYKEGSPELVEWVEDMKDRLYRGHIRVIITELERRLKTIPQKGPGNKGRRKRLEGVITYVTKRRHMMRYGQLRREDYEIASGAAEGAVKHVIAKRFDYGSMRWIRERAQPLLQLRCIEINGDWDAYLDFVRKRLDSTVQEQLHAPTILTSQAKPLPQSVAA